MNTMKKNFILILFLIIGSLTVKSQALLSVCPQQGYGGTNIAYHILPFQTQNQSMWSPGAAFGFDMDYDIIPLVSGCPNLGSNGVSIGVDYHFRSTFSVHGFTTGAIKTLSFPLHTLIDYPEDYSFYHGQAITISTQGAIQNPGAGGCTTYLDPKFPSAGIVALDLEYGFHFNIGFSIAGINLNTVSIGLPLLPSATTSYDNAGGCNILYDSLAIFYLNSQSKPPTVGYPCLDPVTNFPKVCQDTILHVTIPDFFGIGLTGEIGIPYIDKYQCKLMQNCPFDMEVYGETLWAWLNLDVLDFLQFFVQFIPGYGQAISQVIDILQGDVPLIPPNNWVEINYFFINIDVYMGSYLCQQFSFTPTVKTTFTFSTPLQFWESKGPCNLAPVGQIPTSGIVQQGTNNVVTIDLCNNLTLRYPCFGFDSIQVQSVHYHLIPTFRNKTWNELRLVLIFQAIYFEFCIDIPVVKSTPVQMPQFALPFETEELQANNQQALISAQYQLPVYDVNNYTTNTTNAKSKSGANTNGAKLNCDLQFCIPTNCKPLLDFSIPIGTIPIPLYDNTWNIGGWNFTDTTFPGTWLKPRPELEIDTQSTNVLCFGDTTGVLTVFVTTTTQGPYNYTYSWGPTTHISQSNYDQLNVPSGYYVVTVTDNFGCSLSADYNIIDIFPEIIISLTKTDAICHGDATGQIYGSATGGAGWFVWNWNPPNSNIPDFNFPNVPAGWYYVTVVDYVSCTKGASIYVGEPPATIIAPTIVPPSCFGFTNGSLSTTVTGGTPPYTYIWSTGATSSQIINIGTGSYSVTVTDANSCVTTQTFFVSEPTLLQVGISSVDILCYGASTGSVTISPTGGTPPYSYIWSNSATTQNISQLPVGTYSVTVTDANGCSETAQTTLTQPATPMSSSITPTHNICYGFNQGSADLEVTGGTPPYTYLWNNGQTSQDIFNLYAGTYTVTITDNNGCTLLDNTTITQPPQINLNPIVKHVSCFGYNNGSIAVSASGGDAPYQYTWNNGSNSTIITNLSPGSYIITVIDAIGCSVSQSYTIIEPPLLAINNIAITHVLCYGESTGAIDINVIGGTLPYNFTWNNGAITEDLINIPAGVYNVTVIDANGCLAYGSGHVTQPLTPVTISYTQKNVNCFGGSDGAIDVSVIGGTPPYYYNWDNGSGTQDISGLSAGTYNLTVTDDNGCKKYLQVIITQPDLIVINGVIQDVSCYGLTDGAIIVNIQGGVPSYSYIWSNGSPTTSLMNVPAGSYTLSVTDAHNCTMQALFAVNEPAPLQIKSNVTNVLCYGQSTGAIDLIVTGGTTPYNFSWNTGSNSEDLTGLVTGTYIVTVVDTHGCESFSLFNITQPKFPLETNIVLHNVSCMTYGDAWIDLQVTGGTEPYFYMWSNGQIGQDIYNLIPGIYSVLVTDANGCLSWAQTQVTQPSHVLTGTISGTPVTCNGGTDGSVNVAVTGGSMPYQFKWSTGAWEQNLKNMPAGTYTVTVIDANFCHYEMSFVVTEPEPYHFYHTTIPILCSGMEATIGLSLIMGNTAPYTVNWSNGDSGQTITVAPTETTTYSAIVTDSRGCVSAPYKITVNVMESVKMNVSEFDKPVCQGDEVYYFVNVYGGGISGDYVYINGIKRPITIPIRFNVKKDTTFVFEISDTCSQNKISITRNVVVNPNPMILAGSDKFAGCSPLTVNFFEDNNNPTYSYLWNFDDGDYANLSIEKNPRHTFHNSRNYNVQLIVTSEAGCKSEANIPIIVYPIPSAEFTVSATILDIQNPRVEFYDQSDNAAWYFWDFGDSTTSTQRNPIHTYRDVKDYRTVLTIKTQYGCVDTASMKIRVIYNDLFYAPTAFTPNNDGINDGFRVFVSNYDEKTFEMKIFDRWGEIIFKSDNQEDVWTGYKENKSYQNGIYIWTVKYIDLYGEEKVKTGRVTLIK